MKREVLNTLVARDLDHIPRGAKGSPQATLRMVYNAHRRGDLADDPTTQANQTLVRSVATVIQIESYFRPDYDRAYFGELPLTV